MPAVGPARSTLPPCLYPGQQLCHAGRRPEGEIKTVAMPIKNRYCRRCQAQTPHGVVGHRWLPSWLTEVLIDLGVDRPECLACKARDTKVFLDALSRETSPTGHRGRIAP
jgi:hypothetical protein